MAAVALTVALGLTVVYSASGGGSFDRVLSQSRNLAAALVALWLFAQVHPQTLMRLALPATSRAWACSSAWRSSARCATARAAG
jgi:hypothetical protein